MQRIFDVRRQANADTVQPYLDALSAVRLGLASPARVEEEIPDARGLAAGFDAYRAALSEDGVVDFDEQIYRSIEILLRNPDARSSVQSRCRHLLVDEFQDLNPAHMLLIRLLSAPAYECFGVGDDDQVIYGYSGATPEYSDQFRRVFPRFTRICAGGELPVPAGHRRRSPQPALVQPDSDLENDHHATGPNRRASSLRTTSR